MESCENSVEGERKQLKSYNKIESSDNQSKEEKLIQDSY